PDETIRLEVRLENETVWLTQSQMAQLFECTIRNMRLHLKNIYDCLELQEDATRKDFFLVRFEGNREVSRTISCYNLDAIISVGYRVNSILGVRFRQWATSILKNYLLRGYAVNDRLDRLETQRLRQTCGIAVETFRLVNYIIPITNFIPI
ncbi:MAG: virulence RhuM family protein, partial [Victivallales bacterium]|nr:virulence RhuM family protein [Victivallales bacterium]